MSHFQEHKNVFDRPLLLTQEEEKRPILAIRDFFDKYRLSEVREMHEDADRACLVSDIAPFDEAMPRSDLLYFRKNEERVLEAAYLLLQQDQTHSKDATPQSDLVLPSPQLDGEIDLDDLQNRLTELQEKVSELRLMVMKARENASER